MTGIERAEEDVRRVDSEAHQEVTAKRLRLGQPAAVLRGEALVQPGAARGHAAALGVGQLDHQGEDPVGRTAPAPVKEEAQVIEIR